MNIQRRIFSGFLYLSAVLLFSSCSTISFTPKVSLDVSPETINKTVQIDKFKDTSPEKDKRNPFMGLSITSKDALSNNLDLEVTNAVTSDFALNGLFKQVSRRVENPDYFIRGEIKHFSGQSKSNNYAKFSLFAAVAGELTFFIYPTKATLDLFLISTIPLLTSYLGLPQRLNTSTVELTLTVYDKNNQFIKSYTGRAYEQVSTSMYNNNTFGVISMTNKLFSQVVLDIREQILRDKEMY
jgi:hypothetical protein